MREAHRMGEYGKSTFEFIPLELIRISNKIWKSGVFQKNICAKSRVPAIFSLKIAGTRDFVQNFCDFPQNVLKAKYFVKYWLWWKSVLAKLWRSIFVMCGCNFCITETNTQLYNQILRILREIAGSRDFEIYPPKLGAPVRFSRLWPLRTKPSCPKVKLSRLSSF